MMLRRLLVVFAGVLPWAAQSAGLCVDPNMARALEIATARKELSLKAQVTLADYLKRMKELNGHANTLAWSTSSLATAGAVLGAVGGGAYVGGYLGATGTSNLIGGIFGAMGGAILGGSGGGAAAGIGAPVMIKLSGDGQSKLADTFRIASQTELENAKAGRGKPVITSVGLLSEIERYFAAMDQDHQKLTKRRDEALKAFKKGSSPWHLGWDEVKLTDMLLSEAESRRKLYADQEQAASLIVSQVKSMCQTAQGSVAKPAVGGEGEASSH